MHRKALEALSVVRPPMSRLDRSRTPEELSADIVEAWRGTEVAVRALLGGSMASGAALIHEARQRHLLTFEQANSLAAFAAAAGRCSDAAYRPTDNDLNEVREGFDQLMSSLSMVESALKMTPGEAMSTKGLRASPLGTPRPVPLPPEPQPWWFVAVVGLAVVAVVGAGGYFAWRLLGNHPNVSMVNAAADLYSQGRSEDARDAFEDIVRKEPANSLAHTFLARLARESGDLKLAREQATLAIEADPGNVTALREMAAALLVGRDYEMARRFYTRVIEAAPGDLASQGYLGCTLMKLGRPDEAGRWFQRAGSGPWSVCSTPGWATSNKRGP